MTAHFRPPFLLACTIILLGISARESAGAVDPLMAGIELPRWVAWGSAQTGFGYRDNVLLSHSGEERSSFVRGELDATLVRLPTDRVDYYAAFNAGGSRYFSAKTVNHEAQAILLTEWRYRLGETLRFSLDGRGYYFDQIFDVSNSDLQQVVAEVKTLGAGVGPKLRWTVRPGWWVETLGAAKRETYPDGVNNRNVREGTLRLGWKPGRRLEASFAGTERRRNYNTREQSSVSGRSLVDTGLKIDEREGELRVDLTLDRAATWKTTTRFTTLRYRDNGAGYLDYRHRKVAQDVTWERGGWLVSLEGSARRVDFDVQTVGLGIAPPIRVRDDYAAQWHVERKLSPRWTVIADYTWERNRSNDPLASYAMNEGLLGVRWNWEK